MVYSNTKRGAYRSSMVNQSQGGGNKKAGFPYQVGRESWSSIAINTCNPRNVEFKCCNLTNIMKTANSNVCISRPIGSSVASNTFFRCPM